MKKLCSICVRAGSKGVKNKNILPLCGKPLIAHSIGQALETKQFDHIVISTDSDEIASISEQYGAEVFFKRSPELASDTAGKLDVIKDAFIRSENHYQSEFDIQIDLDATSPLRDTQDILNVIDLITQPEVQNVFSVMPSRRSPYFNQVELTSEGAVKLSKSLDSLVLRRQDAPKTYDMNASIYAWKRDAILNASSLFGDQTKIYIMPEERSIDIDSPCDFIMVEALMKHQQSNT